MNNITEYLSLLAGISCQDEDTGESWWGDGWCARFGKRLFYSSEHTGDRTERYATEDQAKDSFNEYEQMWAEADDDDRDRTTD